ncbi:UvrB/UvrC motif-containing protein [Treponema sp. C6A8]|uniref:UvrB/UvrC motif-containing protein n=1 Tax=Treponema sp. C6A8 TaxID=1410609 RepID=UPI0006860912|nr:UvrB/UvrC motif-containing protein [Treponema sp. C6A8]
MTKKICPVCGMTYESISESQKIGCSECYYTFAQEFKKTLKKYGITKPYQGSFPKKLKGYKSTLTSRVEMQFKLEAAIEAEEYEKAAFYRDYLKVLNKEASFSEEESGEKITFDTDSDSDIDLEAKNKEGKGDKNGEE